MPQTDPIDVLMNEHQLILQVLRAMEERLPTLGAGEFPSEFFEQAVDFLAHFADQCHHYKEEDTLFVLLRKRGMPVDGGPIGVMLHEHDTGRAHVAAIRESIPAAAAGSAEALENIRRHAALFIELLRQHIHKEDNILFRMARTLLTPADLAELQEAFAREDNPKINHATRDRYQALAAQLAGTPACVALD